MVQQARSNKPRAAILAGIWPLFFRAFPLLRRVSNSEQKREKVIKVEQTYRILLNKLTGLCVRETLIKFSAFHSVIV
jgi:hypothetical protein